MKIQGQDNQLMLAFPEGEVNCLTTEDAELCALLEARTSPSLVITTGCGCALRRGSARRSC